MYQQPDANVGFTLAQEARTRLMRVFDALAGALPDVSAILTDRAGRIVEMSRKPPGVNLEAIAALAAGVTASTMELASDMGEAGFELVFEHENERQVGVWPVADRALLVVLLKGAAAVQQFEERMEGKLGAELADIITGAREPLRAVPPPRLESRPVPPQVEQKGAALNRLVAEVQEKKPQALAGENASKMLKFREGILQAAGRSDWDRAEALCDEARRWLISLV